MPWFFLLVAIGVAAQPSAVERAAMHSLRHAVASLERTQNQEQFERLAPRSRAATWQRLQHQYRYPRPGAADLAFVLAYYGFDYPRNLQRLLIPYRLWRRGANPSPALESLPEDLMLLYRKRHDTYSLGALLDLKLDGAYSEEQSDVLQHLWPGHEVAILRVASGSPVRLGNVAEMLAGEDADPAQSKETLAEITDYTHHADERVADAAKKVKFLIEAVYSLYSKP